MPGTNRARGSAEGLRGGQRGAIAQGEDVGKLRVLTGLLGAKGIASSNKCHASSNKCLTSSNKKLLELKLS